MAVPKVVTGFSKLKEDGLDTATQTVINKMTGNPYFPAPQPSLAELQVALNEFMTAMADLKAGRGSVTVKDQKKTILLNQVNKLATYVQLNCQDNEAIVESSGFSVRQPNKPARPLEKPGLKVEPNGPGQAKLTATPNGADSYQFEYTLAPATAQSSWVITAGTKSKTVIAGLTSGKQYTFRVVGIGADPSRVYSDEISSFVL